MASRVRRAVQRCQRNARGGRPSTAAWSWGPPLEQGSGRRGRSAAPHHRERERQGGGGSAWRPGKGRPRSPLPPTPPPSPRTLHGKHEVCHFERSFINNPGPCVLFATPGMISGGFSLEAFKKWAPSEKNLITLPGYCVSGTIGHKLMCGKPTRIDYRDTHIDVRCQIHQLAFSPHTDSKGIMDLTEFLSPKHVILVHGEKPQMAFLKERIESELGMPCYFPGNNESISIPTIQNLKMSATERFISSCAVEQGKRSLHKRNLVCDTGLSEVSGSDEEVAEGVLLMEKHKSPKILCEDELLEVLGMERHTVQFEPMVSRIVAAVETELQRAKAADLDSDGK